ncbi:hypothetical protein VaNZ11_001564 [Volvox africanus]|uniref:NUC153 domain-containing protein n=1 Tax=Volvox africanus TaxID=51714 RepID=A0ABQ5RQB4_9CHLO|nr:hypothetical protein VaNZ11_001564 [Volvox africanus]
MGKPDGLGGGQAAADPRFAAMHSDPRFQRFPKQKNKLVVDKRFSAMFEDPEFQSRSAVDKRGRKIESRRKGEDLRRYYRLRDEDEWREGGGDGEDVERQPAELPPAGQPAVAQKQRKQGKEKAAGGSQLERLKQQLHQATVQEREAVPQDHAKTRKSKDAKAVVGNVVVTNSGAQVREAKRQHASAEASGFGAGGTAVRQSDAAAADRKGSEEDMEEIEKSSEGEEEEEEEDGTEGEEADEDGEEAKARERWARARGMLGSESSDEEGEEYDSADEALTDEEYESDEHLDPEEWGAGANALNPQEPIPPQEETRRLALVDLDWDHVRAMDVLAVLRSFLPRGGLLERVTVYPSDYGLQRMAEEAAAGPKLILKPTQRAAVRGISEAAAASTRNKEKGEKENNKKRRGKAGDDEDEDAAEVDKKRLAAYEKSRLRYYYCIVECDCIATALHLYNECDGMEFERSACKFDIRFVPDDQSFEGRQIRDTATEVPPGYEPPAHFNISLQHTDPKLSWDAEDPERKRKLQGRRLKTDQELLEADFSAYLGSEEDDDDGEEAKDTLLPDQQEGQEAAAAIGAEEGWEAAKGARSAGKENAEALRRRYRTLLLGETAADASKTKGRVGGKSWLGDEDGEEGNYDGTQEEEEGDRQVRARGHRGASEPSTSGRGGAGSKGDVDMVVTFHSGLEGLGERLKKKKEEERARAGETVWEAYLRKKREKRALRKAQGRLRNLSDSEDSEDYISDGEEDAGGNSKDKGKGKEKGKRKKDRADKGNQGGDDDDMYDNVAPDDPFFKDDHEDPFADPFFNQDGDGANAAAAGTSDDSDAGEGRRARVNERKQKSKKGGTAGDKAATGNERADLDLLLMNDAALRDAARGVKSRVLPAGHDVAAAGGKHKLTKKEKLELKKEARRKARAGSDDEDAAGAGDEDAVGFAVNLDDPRFVDMFQNAEYALDPTDPRFKKMQAREKVMTEVQKRRAQQPTLKKLEDLKQGQQEQNGASAAAENGATDAPQQQRGASSDLRIMVAKLKRKAEAHQEKERAQALGKGQKKARL